MTNNVRLLTVCSLAFLLGCPNVENSSVEHSNVCIDLSPDGEKLVFSSADGDLYLYDVSESTVTRLTDTDRIESYPSYSPDGKQIAFAAMDTDTAPSRIYVLSLDDRTISPVSDGSNESDILPRFTPDGKRIVFARSYRHRPYSLGGSTWDMWDVCSINADGSEFSRLTKEGYYRLYRIVPLKDENFVFAADSMGLDTPATLYKVSKDGKPDQLTPELGISDANVHAWASDPMVSPDGKSMAYCSDRTKSFWYDVCVDLGDSNLKGLVGSKSRYNRYPDFFPDGQRIVFLAGTDFNAGNRPIYRLWEVTLSAQTRELAPSDLFTNPTNWLDPRRAEPSDAME